MHKFRGEDAENCDEDPRQNVIDEETIDSHHQRASFEGDYRYDHLKSSWARQRPAKIQNFFELCFTEPFMLQDKSVMSIS